MAQVLLKYNLSDVDDREEFMRTIKSRDMAMMLWEVMLNDKKYIQRQLESDNEATEREFDLVDKIWKHIFARAEEHGIEIENLIS